MSARRRRARYRGIKRIPVRVAGFEIGRINLNVGGIFRALTGRARPLRRGETRADQLGSITVGKPGGVSWNTRTDDLSVNTPGWGGWAYRLGLRRRRDSSPGASRRRPQLDADEADPGRPGIRWGRVVALVLVLTALAALAAWGAVAVDDLARPVSDWLNHASHP